MIQPESDSPPVRRRMLGPQVPAEGADGLFSQSWFPICLSTDVPVGTVKGYPFLDGRVVVFRGADGVVKVMSAYCAHLGADLAQGCVVGNHVQCAFHKWRFDAEGQCRATGVGDPPPPRANLFAFPTVEQYGLVWAFNGETPLFDIPRFPFADDRLVVQTQAFPLTFDVDPWVVCAQTPDIQHVLLLHQFQLIGPHPAGNVEWTPHSMFYNLHATARGRVMDIRAGIMGTSIFFQTGQLDGRWFGFLVGMGMPRAGTTMPFAVLAAERGSGSEAEVHEFLDECRAHEIAIASEDAPIASTIHFKVGSLTQADATLARFITYLRNYPRAHPSAQFIN